MSAVAVFNPSGEYENPRKRRRGGKRRRRSSSPRRRRARARRNPGNPPRRRRRRSRAYRNPAQFMGLNLHQVGLGVAGAIGVDLGGEYLARMLPAQFQGGAGKYAVKGGLILGSSLLLGKFVGRSAAAGMALGGAIMLGAEAVHEFVLPRLTGGAVNGYEFVPGISGYVEEGMNGLGAPGWSPGWGGASDF